MLPPGGPIVNARFAKVRQGRYSCAARGRSSGVERQLPKLNVVGSNPIARSKDFRNLVLLAPHL